MNLRTNIMACLLAGSVATATLAGTFGIASYMQRRLAIGSSPLPDEKVAGQQMDPALVRQGRSLFLMNCAHCHADDATGDEGPDLHGLVKSDARIAALINNGIKGEMPRFNQKLGDSDVHAIVTFLDTLR